MKKFAAERIVRTYTHHYEGPSSKVFPLLCPIREYDWIEGWNCEMIASESGFAENNCIFKTGSIHGHDEKNHDGENHGEEIWVVSRYEPDCAIEFVRVTPKIKVFKLDIRLKDMENNVTEAVWTHMVTALSEEGNKVIEQWYKNAYQQKMSFIEKMMNHYLATGERLKVSA